MKDFEELQGLSHSPRKIILYSPTKFGILKPWTNIQSLGRFDLVFWQISKQIHRKLQYRDKTLEEFQGLFLFSRKVVLYSSTKFGLLKTWTNIKSLRKFDLGFWQTSKQIYQKLQYREKVFREFEGLCRFPRKMIVYSSAKFCILKPWTNTLWHRRFQYGFWQSSVHIYRKLQDKEKAFEEFQG